MTKSSTKYKTLPKKKVSCRKAITGWDLPGQYNKAEIRRVKRLLQLTIPRRCCLENEVAVIGSWSLHAWQAETNVGPVWNDRPNDIDIFVCGDTGATEGKFKAFVKHCMNNMEENGYTITKDYKHRNQYVMEDADVLIWNVKVRGLSQEISFIHCPTQDCIHEVAERFDISVCKVIYCIHPQGFSFKGSVMDDIRNSEASINPRVKYAVRGQPSDLEIAKVSGSMKRMRKYTRRGFKFDRNLAVVFK